MLNIPGHCKSLFCIVLFSLINQSVLAESLISCSAQTETVHKECNSGASASSCSVTTNGGSTIVCPSGNITSSTTTIVENSYKTVSQACFKLDGSLHSCAPTWTSNGITYHNTGDTDPQSCHDPFVGSFECFYEGVIVTTNPVYFCTFKVPKSISCTPSLIIHDNLVDMQTKMVTWRSEINDNIQTTKQEIRDNIQTRRQEIRDNIQTRKQETRDNIQTRKQDVKDNIQTRKNVIQTRKEKIKIAREKAKIIVKEHQQNLDTSTDDMPDSSQTDTRTTKDVDVSDDMPIGSQPDTGSCSGPNPDPVLCKRSFINYNIVNPKHIVKFDQKKNRTIKKSLNSIKSSKKIARNQVINPKKDLSPEKLASIRQLGQTYQSHLIDALNVMNLDDGNTANMNRVLTEYFSLLQSETNGIIQKFVNQNFLNIHDAQLLKGKLSNEIDLYKESLKNLTINESFNQKTESNQKQVLQGFIKEMLNHLLDTIIVSSGFDTKSIKHIAVNNYLKNSLQNIYALVENEAYINHGNLYASNVDSYELFRQRPYDYLVSSFQQFDKKLKQFDRKQINLYANSKSIRQKNNSDTVLMLKNNNQRYIYLTEQLNYLNDRVDRLSQKPNANNKKSLSKLLDLQYNVNRRYLAVQSNYLKAMRSVSIITPYTSSSLFVGNQLILVNHGLSFSYQSHNYDYDTYSGDGQTRSLTLSRSSNYGMVSLMYSHKDALGDIQTNSSNTLVNAVESTSLTADQLQLSSLTFLTDGTLSLNLSYQYSPMSFTVKGNNVDGRVTQMLNTHAIYNFQRIIGNPKHSYLLLSPYVQAGFNYAYTDKKDFGTFTVGSSDSQDLSARGGLATSFQYELQRHFIPVISGSIEYLINRRFSDTTTLTTQLIEYTKDTNISHSHSLNSSIGGSLNIPWNKRFITRVGYNYNYSYSEGGHSDYNNFTIEQTF